MRTAWPLLLALLLSGCDLFGSGGVCPSSLPLPDNAGRVTISQGVWGNVLFLQGDFMPSTDPCGNDGTTRSVVREVQVYELVLVEGAPPVFYEDVPTPLVAVSRSDEHGFFQMSLQPGRYSLFVVEPRPEGDTLLYTNGFRSEAGKWLVQPVDVVPDNVVRNDLSISYAAAF